MRRYIYRAGIPVAILTVALLLAHFRAFGQAPNSADPIFATWKMDQAKSFTHRGEAISTFPTQHIRILAQVGNDELRNTLFNSPTSSPSYSYAAKLDGKEYPDPRASGKEQTLTHWRLAPDFIVRLQRTDGKPSEWVVYTVSSDGKVFTSLSWSPAHPELQDFQVFTRAN